MIQHPIQHTWSERLIWWLMHQFGALPILACIFTGAIVLILIIFKKWVADKFGAFIKLADQLVNGKDK